MPRFTYIAALISIPLLVVVSGCNLPGIPSDLSEERDAAVAPGDGEDSSFICEPNSRECLTSLTIQVCSPDGTDFQVEACATGTTCTEGECTAIENTCGRGQPFAVTPTELVFDVSEDFKAQSRELLIDNCGTKPLTVHGLNVRGPTRPDGEPVFTLSEESPSGGRLDPGRQLPIKVIYRPAQGLSQVRGNLELELITDSVSSFDVELRTRALCATASPLVNLGLASVGETQTGISYLQNCGTEPLRLSTVVVSSPPNSDVRKIELTPSEKVPSTLRPGQNVAVSIELTPTKSGIIRDTILIGFEESELPPLETVVLATAVEEPCSDFPVPDVRTTIRNIPAMGDPIIAPPLEILRFAVPSSDHMLNAEVLDAPDLNRVVMRYDDAHMPYFRPTVAGTYLLSFRAIDPQSGRASCDSTPMQIEVDPTSPLHIELTWMSPDDAVPEDSGFGRGVNLDLHVLAENGESARWNKPDQDCFSGASMPCGPAEGMLLSQSRSGDVAEIVAFEEPENESFKIGVYLSNPFNFESVVARIRIFRDGELHGELTTDRLREANDFWLAGRYDASETNFEITDAVTTNFPK